jgi:hypothetical protein
MAEKPGSLSTTPLILITAGGEHWMPWNTGLVNLTAGTNGNNVASVLALSSDGEVLYFGTNGSGVWQRRLTHE